MGFADPEKLNRKSRQFRHGNVPALPAFFYFCLLPCRVFPAPGLILP